MIRSPLAVDSYLKTVKVSLVSYVIDLLDLAGLNEIRDTVDDSL